MLSFENVADKKSCRDLSARVGLSSTSRLMEKYKAMFILKDASGAAEIRTGDKYC